MLLRSGVKTSKSEEGVNGARRDMDGDHHDHPPRDPRYKRVLIVTHVNIFLYAMCFWIQNGSLPVNILLYSFSLVKY